MAASEDFVMALRRFENPNAAKEIQKRLHSLPGAAARIGVAFLERQTRSLMDPEADARQSIQRELVDLGEFERRLVFQTLFPTIADHVENTWQMLRRLPYQTGYLRRAFRAPTRPDYTNSRRVQWVDELLRALLQYDYDVDFLTAWPAHMGWHAEEPVGLLLAGVLSSDSEAGTRALETLLKIVNGHHEVASPSRYVILALLCSSRPEAWGAVERLLLAAQRQEGLRQVILEAVDLAHPEAFLRMLRLIEKEKLSRFAAVARSVSVWLGLMIESDETKLIDGLVHAVAASLENPDLRDQQISTAEGQELYVALWALAFEDVSTAIRRCASLTKDEKFKRRYVAVHLLTQIGTPEAAEALVGSLRDEDIRIAVRAADAFPARDFLVAGSAEDETVIQALRELIDRMPNDLILDAAIWPWNRIRANKSSVAAKLLNSRDNLKLVELSPYLPALDARGRWSLLSKIQHAAWKTKVLRSDERDLALRLLGDPSNSVRQVAFEILTDATLTPHEAEGVEGLLSRKSSDIRRGAIRLLLKQKVSDCRASIDRLAASSNALMRQAAEEIQSELEPQSIASASLDDGFGLFNPTERTQLIAPRQVFEGKISTPQSAEILKALDAFIHKHREIPVPYRDWNGTEARELLGNLEWFYDTKNIPRKDLWTEWWTSYRQQHSEADDIALLQALCTSILISEERDSQWELKVSKSLVDAKKPRYLILVRAVLLFLAIDSTSTKGLFFLMDVLEAHLWSVGQHFDFTKVERFQYEDSRTSELGDLMRVIDRFRTEHPEHWDHEIWRRYWGLLRWVDEGMRSKWRQQPPLPVIAELHRRGIASDADLYEHLLGSERGSGNAALAILTRRKADAILTQYPQLAPFAEQCRKRILEVELKRGDLPTPASRAALALMSVYGAELVLDLLQLFGKDQFSRGYLFDNESRSVVFSHLVRVSFPASDDTVEAFAEYARKRGIARKRLVELALYAPQWVRHVARATGIGGFEDAAHWMRAHTKDDQWSVAEDIRKLWFAEVSERTPLTSRELLDGAVDVAWFERVRESIAEEDWNLIFDSAKFASGGGGHKRAQLFASALLGEIDSVELAARMHAKRNQDAVRALGLPPLPNEASERRRELLQRYEWLQQFSKESSKFGAMRQASEKAAYQIGLTNLARTAGYADPQRLSWAMEAEAVVDLKAGTVEREESGVRGVLSVNASGEPELVFYRGERVLKAIPASLKKSPELAGLRVRKTQLAQQTVRMRLALEAAMIRGDRYRFAELVELMGHPLLRPMAEALVFIRDDGATYWGAAISGEVETAGHKGHFRVAHPVDLLKSGKWSELQKQCLTAGRMQPFKQLFRELYLPTNADLEQKNHSSRYDGHQVNHRQAMALLGARGWVSVPDEGARKTFHHEGVSVWITFLNGFFTPVEVDGTTLQSVLFTRRDDGSIIPVSDVDARIFSEAMRDVDLVVSVAHRGGVDPEATASTVEMRSALLRETLSLLKIHNVRLQGAHAFVDGSRGSYNVHLGSGVVHQMPGGSIAILPVHSQHRGRLFLPFADNDPKTAEVISKVLLLAQDDKIKDPTILEQLR